jgi:hypothetical protein
LVADPSCGYRRDFDVYSLGVILVEIGFWRSIGTFQKPKYNAYHNRTRLLEHQLCGDLAHRMSQRYEDAVRSTILENADNNQLDEGEQLVGFLRRVVFQVESNILS